MTKQEIYNTMVKNFEYIYSKLKDYHDYKLRPNQNQVKQISSFIDYLDKQIGLSSIGEDWIFNYLVFSFKQRSEQDTRFKGKIMLNWILGKKAYELYEKRGENWLYWNNIFIKQYFMSFDDLTSLNEIKTNDFYEEIRRQNFHTEMPLHLCLDTVSFSSKSTFCMRCKNKENCKLIN